MKRVAEETRKWAYLATDKRTKRKSIKKNGDENIDFVFFNIFALHIFLSIPTKFKKASTAA